MATFVDLAHEKDQASLLVGFLEKKMKTKTQPESSPSEQKTEGEGEVVEEKSDLQKECSLLSEKGDYRSLVQKLLPFFDTAFEGTDAEVEGLFSIICSIIRKIDITQRPDELLIQILNQITSKKTDRPLLRLRILNNLFNIFPETSIDRFYIFRHILVFSMESSQTDITLGELSKTQGWLNQWSASTEQARELYLIISKIYKDHDQTGNVFETLQKYLATFDHVEDQHTLDSPSIEVEKVILQAIQLPEVFQIDNLLDLKAVQQFERSSDARQKKLYKLLQIFANENLNAFQQFSKENSSFLSSIGLNEQDCENKMRLLSLMTLASESEELSFKVICSELDVKENEVPRWVVSAVSAGLLEAKIDQIRNVVLIERSTQRSFSIGQWQHLANKMKSWRENISQILQIIQATRATQDAHP